MESTSGSTGPSEARPVLVTRNVRYQPYSDHDQNSAPLLYFLTRYVTVLDPAFKVPPGEWTETKQEDDWDMVTVRSCGEQQGYRVTYKETLEPRAMGIAVSGVTVEAFGLPPGYEFSLKCERSWYDPRYLELRLSGPEPAVGTIESSFRVEFEPRYEQPLSETQVRIELVSAESSLKVGAWSAAEMRARTVLKWQPDNVQAAFILGTALLAQKNYSDGESYLRAALIKDNKHVDAWYNLGNVMLDTGRPAEAELCYLKALALSPDNHPTFYRLGVALEQVGLPDEALEAYHNALRTAPNPGQVFHYTGLDFEVRAQEAIARLAASGDAGEPRYSPNTDSSQPLSAEQAVTSMQVAQQYLNMAKWPQAERRVRAVVEAQPEDKEAHRMLGTALYAQDKLDEAEAHLRKVLEVEPGNYRALFNLGGLQLKREQPEQALEFFGRALGVAHAVADRHAVHYVTARALETLDRQEEAVAAYREVLASIPASGKSFQVEAEKGLARLEQNPGSA